MRRSSRYVPNRYSSTEYELKVNQSDCNIYQVSALNDAEYSLVSNLQIRHLETQKSNRYGCAFYDHLWKRWNLRCSIRYKHHGSNASLLVVSSDLHVTINSSSTYICFYLFHFVLVFFVLAGTFYILKKSSETTEMGQRPFLDNSEIPNFRHISGM